MTWLATKLNLYKPQRILFTGSRNWTDYDKIKDALASVGWAGDTVVHGDAEGADQIAADAAHSLGMFVEAHPASNYRSPRERNQAMVDKGADICVAAAETWASRHWYVCPDGAQSGDQGLRSGRGHGTEAMSDQSEFWRKIQDAAPALDGLRVDVTRAPAPQFTLDDLVYAYRLMGLTLRQRAMLQEINAVSETEPYVVVCHLDDEIDLLAATHARRAPTEVVANEHLPEPGRFYVMKPDSILDNPYSVSPETKSAHRSDETGKE